MQPQRADNAPANRVLTTFGEGFNEGFKRTGNSMNYMGGYIQDAAGFDQHNSEVIEGINSQYGSISNVSNADIERRIAELERNQELYKIQKSNLSLSPSQNTFRAAPRVDNYKSEMEEQYLRNVLDMRANSATDTEIEDYSEKIASAPTRGEEIMAKSVNEAINAPTLKGAAKAGDISSSLLSSLIPITASIVNPTVGIALGAADVAMTAAISNAEAGIALDAYEQQHRTKLSNKDRVLYKTAVTAADALIGAVMQTQYLKKASAPLFKNVYGALINRFSTDAVARKEFSKLMKNSIGETAKEIGSLSLKQGGASAVTTNLKDLSIMIFTNENEYPTLSEMVTNASVAAATGASVGAVLGGVGSLRTRSKIRLNTKTLIDDMDGETYNLLGLDGSTYKAVNADGAVVDLNPASVKNIRTEDVDMKQRVKLSPDKSKEGIASEKESTKLWRTLDTWDRDSEAKDVSLRLGVDIESFDNIEAIPQELQKYLRDGKRTVTFANPETGKVAVILDNIKNEQQLVRGLKRDGIYARTLNAGTSRDFDEVIEEVYKIIPQSKRLAYGLRKSKYDKAIQYLEDIYTNTNRGAVQNVFGRVKANVKEKFGIKRLSDNDLLYFIWLGNKRIKADDSIKEMNQKGGFEKLFNDFIDRKRNEDPDNINPTQPTQVVNPEEMGQLSILTQLADHEQPTRSLQPKQQNVPNKIEGDMESVRDVDTSAPESQAETALNNRENGGYLYKTPEEVSDGLEYRRARDIVGRREGYNDMIVERRNPDDVSRLYRSIGEQYDLTPAEFEGYLKGDYYEMVRNGYPKLSNLERGALGIEDLSLADILGHRSKYKVKLKDYGDKGSKKLFDPSSQRAVTGDYRLVEEYIPRRQLERAYKNMSKIERMRLAELRNEYRDSKSPLFAGEVSPVEDAIVYKILFGIDAEFTGYAN